MWIALSNLIGLGITVIKAGITNLSQTVLGRRACLNRGLGGHNVGKCHYRATDRPSPAGKNQAECHRWHNRRTQTLHTKSPFRTP